MNDFMLIDRIKRCQAQLPAKYTAYIGDAIARATARHDLTPLQRANLERMLAGATDVKVGIDSVVGQHIPSIVAVAPQQDDAQLVASVRTAILEKRIATSHHGFLMEVAEMHGAGQSLMPAQRDRVENILAGNI